MLNKNFTHLNDKFTFIQPKLVHLTSQASLRHLKALKTNQTFKLYPQIQPNPNTVIIENPNY